MFVKKKKKEAWGREREREWEGNVHGKGFSKIINSLVISSIVNGTNFVLTCTDQILYNLDNLLNKRYKQEITFVYHVMVRDKELITTFQCFDLLEALKEVLLADIAVLPSDECLAYLMRQYSTSYIYS